MIVAPLCLDTGVPRNGHQHSDQRVIGGPVQPSHYLFCRSGGCPRRSLSPFCGSQSQANLERMTTDVNAIRAELVGDSAVAIPYSFVLAMLSVLKWPVDAFSLSFADLKVDGLYWVQEGTIGWLSVVGDADTPNISAVVRPASEIASLTVLGAIRDDNFGNPNRVERAVTVSFRTPRGDLAVLGPLQIGLESKNTYLRGQTDKLINALLDSVTKSRH